MRLIIFFLMLIILSFCSCTAKEQLSYRLENFCSILDDVSLVHFENGKISEVVKYINYKNNNDKNFKKKYQKMKKDEGIDFFTTKQFVEFYYNNFIPVKVN